MNELINNFDDKINISQKENINELNYYKNKVASLKNELESYKNKVVSLKNELDNYKNKVEYKTTQNQKLEISSQKTISIRPPTTWDTYILHAHNRMINNKNTKEIGKIRANAAEYFVVDWLNNFLQKNGYEPKWITIHAEDVIQCSKFELKSSDPNSSGFDIYLLNRNTHKYFRIQVKYRNSDFHFETTRRNSKKNENKNTTGHVVYSADEFDILIGICTFNNLSNELPTDKNISIIDIDILKDPKNPENLISKISNKTRNICIDYNKNYLHKILCNSKQLILPQILGEIRLQNFKKIYLHCCCELLKIKYKKETMDILISKIQKKRELSCYNIVINSINRSKNLIDIYMNKVNGCFWVTPKHYVCFYEKKSKKITESNDTFTKTSDQEKYRKYKNYQQNIN